MLPGLVDSRLAVPSLPPWHVARPRLVAALDNVANVPLVLLSAAPGAGKTVLLAEWAGRSRGRVGWLSPTPDDNEPGRFRDLLASALRVSPDPFSSQAGHFDFVHWLREELAGEGAPCVLAVDDAHLLTSPQVIDLLDKLVCYGHPQLHVVLAARHDPSLPLHRYRLAGQLRELRTPELAMTVAEVRDVLRAHRIVLPESGVSGLAARTEGWAAGARLAAMRMEQESVPAGLADEPSFGHGSAGEYFVAEVLDQLGEPLRRLLIETSFLDEVTAPLAEAVSGIDGAGGMLAELARGNWFVTALDSAETRFRYHRLFAEALRHLLLSESKHSVPELAGRAAACLERAGDLAGALRWAAKGGDPSRVACAVVQGGMVQA
ncbi:MAG: AAA family ATPase, partial [Trebonia sp.]